MGNVTARTDLNNSIVAFTNDVYVIGEGKFDFNAV